MVAKLLLGRGIGDPRQASLFLDAKLTGLREPELLPGLTGAADRVHAAIQQGRRIVIYGDYDADGMTATGLLFCCLRLLGADVGYYVPNRLDEGYGLNDEALRQAGRARHVAWSFPSIAGSAASAEAETARNWAWS